MPSRMFLLLKIKTCKQVGLANPIHHLFAELLKSFSFFTSSSLLWAFLGLSLLLSKPALAQTRVLFTLSFDREGRWPKPEDRIGIRGSIPPLSWNYSLEMSDPEGDGLYELAVVFDNDLAAGELKYTYVINDEEWETIDQRIIYPEITVGLPKSDYWNLLKPIRPILIPEISSDGLMKDLRLSRNALLSLHPAAKRYQSVAQIERKIEVLERQFYTGKDLAKAYLGFAGLFQTLGSGLTSLKPESQELLTKRVLFDQPDKLPFCFRIVEDFLVITHNATGNSLLDPGTVVHEIDGRPTRKILDSISALLPLEGTDERNKKPLLAVAPGQEYPWFDVLFPLLYPNPDQIHLLNVLPAGQKTNYEVLVRGVNRQERDRRLVRYGVWMLQPDSAFEVKWLDKDSLAVVQVKKFEREWIPEDWEKYLSTFIRQAETKKHHGLVIDLRGATGNDRWFAEALFRYFTVLKEAQPTDQFRAKYRMISSDFSPYLTTDDSADLNLSDRIAAVEDTAFLLREELEEVSSRRVPVYKGRIWLLTDGATGDGVYQFVRRMKSQGRGIMIAAHGLGPTTGRAQAPIGRLRLPGSGIVVEIPLVDRKEPRFRTPALDPEIRTIETLEDVLQNKSVAWEALKKEAMRK